MNAENTFLKVQSAIQNAPLESILETAESVSLEMPAVGKVLEVVIKLLKSLIKFRPLANNLLGTGAQAASLIQNVKNGNAPMDKTTNNICKESSDKYEVTCDLSEEENVEAAEHAEILTMLDKMVEIAAEDGELSDEEMEYLIDIAREVGMNERVLLEKVKMKCLQNK